MGDQIICKQINFATVWSSSSRFWLIFYLLISILNVFPAMQRLIVSEYTLHAVTTILLGLTYFSSRQHPWFLVVIPGCS